MVDQSKEFHYDFMCRDVSGTFFIVELQKYWENDRFVSEYTFREKESHDLLAETIVIIFVEMAHFNKRIEDCVTDLDKMLYLLKFIGKMMEQPAWLQKTDSRKINALSTNRK